MSGDSRLGLACIGAGHWGPNLIRNFVDHAKCTVRLIVDKDARRLPPLGARYGVDTASDATEAFTRADVQAVVIATPTATHYEIARAALLAGKHVLVEKPITASVPEAQALRALAAERGLILMVGHVFLFNPGVIWVKQHLDSGALGRVLHITAQRTNLGPIRTDVNAAWDLASHDVSILNYWLGRAPTSASARGGAWVNPGVADAVFATLRYGHSPGSTAADDVLAHVHASWLEPRKVRLITVVGDRGMLTLDDMNTTEPVRLYDRGVDVAPPREGGIIDTFGAFRTSLRNGDIRIPVVPGGEPLRTECDAFVRAVLGEGPLRSGADTGEDVVRTLVAIQRSLDGTGAEEQV